MVCYTPRGILRKHSTPARHFLALHGITGKLGSEQNASNGERGTGNGEWGAGSGEPETGSGKREGGNGEREGGKGEWGRGKGEWGMGKGEWGMARVPSSPGLTGGSSEEMGPPVRPGDDDIFVLEGFWVPRSS